MKIVSKLHHMIGTLKSLYYNIDKESFATCGENVILEYPIKINRPQNVYLGNDVAIRGGLTVISHTGKLIIKDHVDISQSLTVVTGNHTTKPPLNTWQVDCNHSGLGDKESDVIIENDVWIGINVTIMPNVKIGRGSIIGACSVVTKDIPPYSIAVGNPCKVIRVKFTKDEIIEREKILYPEGERLDFAYIKSLFHNK